MTRTLVVGDVHGCAHELRELLALAQAERVVFVGDLFTKGPDPCGVYALAKRHESVLGNHDARLIQHLDGQRQGDTHAAEVVGALDSAPEWRDWLRALPLFLEVEEFTVVHAGVHPNGLLEDTTAAMATLMRRFPMNDCEAPFWYAQYEGSRPVIFGHDAKRGLVRVERAGAPFIIGLDTGCVYGGQLSGYLVEEDVVLQVPAADVYCPY